MAPLRCLGLTGSNSAGKGVTAEHLVARHGYTALSLSDVVRDEARARGLPPERDVLIRIGNELRRAGGPGVLAERIADQLVLPAVVDSIRNPAEVEVLRRRVPGFVLVAVEAPPEVRFGRSLARARPGDPATLEAFLAKEGLENSRDPAAQQLEATAALADRVLANSGTLDDLRERIDALLRDLA